MMTPTTHRTRAVVAGALAALILLAGFTAGWVGKIAADDRADDATTAAKAVADPVVEKCDSNTPAGKALRAEAETCEQARQVQKVVEDEREPVLVPVPGPEGPRGFVGPVGPGGRPGDDGRTGKPGSNGQDAADGLDGTNGTNGTDGTSGQNGTPGTNGTDATNEQVDAGVAEWCTPRGDCIGKTGDQGPEGPEGPTGPPGVVATAVSPGCSDPSPAALMTFDLLYDPATQTITLVCTRG